MDSGTYQPIIPNCMPSSYPSGRFSLITLRTALSAARRSAGSAARYWATLEAVMSATIPAEPRGGQASCTLLARGRHQRASGLAPHSGKVYHQGMNRLSGFVSLHPYFKVPPDKMPHLKAILPEFAAKTRNETGNLFYEFTINGDEVFCREGYVNAEALLAHLENVGAMLAQALAMADLIRIEVHGPAAELAKLKEPLAHLKPAWFELHS